MWLFSRIQLSTSVRELIRWFATLCHLLLSPTLPALDVGPIIHTVEEGDQQRRGVGRWASYRQGSRAGKHFDNVQKEVSDELKPKQGLPHGGEEPNERFYVGLLNFLSSIIMPRSPSLGRSYRNRDRFRCRENWFRTFKRNILISHSKLKTGEFEPILKDRAARRKESLTPADATQ